MLAGLVALTAWPGMASAAASGVDVSATEGASFTQRVANLDSICTFNSATIDWGDGTPSSQGQYQAGNPPSLTGTHTYAEEGTFSGTVTIYTDCPMQVVTFRATVADAPLSATGQAISPTAGDSFTGIVSHFTDADPQGTASDFSAQIDWGDGSRSAGTVSASAGGGFDVTGTHTYQHPGDASVNVTITDAGGRFTQSSAGAHIFAVPLHAQFSYTPSLPCRDQPVTFVSSSGPALIAQYDWNFPRGYLQGSPTEEETFGYSGLTRVRETHGKVVHRFYGSFPLYHIHLLREPRLVTLTVTGSDGRVASTQQTVTFRNPDDTGLAAFDVICLVNSGWLACPEIFRRTVIVYWKPDHPGPCEGNVGAIGSTVAGVIAPQLGLNANASLSARVSCPRVVACLGRLLALPGPDVVSRTARAAASPGRSAPRIPPLGRATLRIAAGQAQTVRIALTKRGRRLARNHRLKHVILVLYDKAGGTQSLTLKVRTSKR